MFRVLNLRWVAAGCGAIAARGPARRRSITPARSSHESTTITHGPALGLRIYQDYTLEFIAYADEQRTKEIDRLTRKIRSYVDTTGPHLKLFDGMKTKTTDTLQEHSAPPAPEQKR